MYTAFALMVLYYKIQILSRGKVVQGIAGLGDQGRNQKGEKQKNI